MILLLTFLFGCGNKIALEPVVVRDDNDELVESYFVDAEGKRQGEYKRFYQGTMRELSHYENDTLHGIRTIYDEGGVMEIEETYDRGSFAGTYRTYYPSGQLELEGDYHNDVMEGNWSKYYPSGELMEVVQMKNNNENGPFIEYHPNGKLKAEGQYANGDKEQGLLQMYDTTGSLIRKMMCDSGVCRTIWSIEKGIVDG